MKDTEYLEAVSLRIDERVCTFAQEMAANPLWVTLKPVDNESSLKQPKTLI